MKLLEDRIKKDGIVLPGNILKVNSFLNHQIDVELLDKLAEDFKKSFDGVDITKVVTIEASGIAVACSVARAFGNIPVLFAKKHTSAALSDDVYYSTVWSHTNSCNYNIVISREYLSSDELKQALVTNKHLTQEQADTVLASVMSAYGGVENSLKPVREQIKGASKDYNTLTKFMDLAKNIA